jgi:hypothetical protein
MRLILIGLAGLLFLGLGGCVMPGADAAYLLSREYPRENLSPQHFVVCSHHGCTKETEVSLTDDEWQEIRDIFAAPPAVGEPDTPEGERAQIAFALARMEQLVAPQANTGGDVGGSFSGFGLRDQLDCVDEMVNTATYLTMMYNDGLFRFHRPGHRETEALSVRGFWPHTVMTVYDTTTDQDFVIDTWIKDNGEVPYVMALSDWKRGVHHHDLVTGEELDHMIF